MIKARLPVEGREPPGTQALLGKLIQKSKAGGHCHLFGSGWRNWTTDEAMWGSPKGSTRRIRGDFICICEFSHAHILNALRWARNSAGAVYSDKMSSDFPGNGESSTKKIGNPHISRKLSHLKLQFPPFLTLCLGPQPHSITSVCFPCQELEQTHHSTGI